MPLLSTKVNSKSSYIVSLFSPIRYLTIISYGLSYLTEEKETIVSSESSFLFLLTVHKYNVGENVETLLVNNSYSSDDPFNTKYCW